MWPDTNPNSNQNISEPGKSNKTPRLVGIMLMPSAAGQIQIPPTTLRLSKGCERLWTSCCPFDRQKAPRQAGFREGTSWYLAQRSQLLCAHHLSGPTWWWAAPPGQPDPGRGCEPCWYQPPLLERKPTKGDCYRVCSCLKVIRNMFPNTEALKDGWCGDAINTYPVQSGNHQQNGSLRSRKHRRCPPAAGTALLCPLQDKGNLLELQAQNLIEDRRKNSKWCFKTLNKLKSWWFWGSNNIMISILFVAATTYCHLEQDKKGTSQRTYVIRRNCWANL